MLLESLAILSEIFIQIGYFFWELCKQIYVGVFSEHSVYHQHSFFITCDIYISKHASPRTILQTVMCKCANSFSFWGTWSPDPLDPTGGLPSREPPDRQCLFYRPLWGGIPPLKNFQKSPKKIWRYRRTRGTNWWMDDTDKNFGPDLPLLFKLHGIWSVDSQENH